jgi:hypothetical protein
MMTMTPTQWRVLHPPDTCTAEEAQQVLVQLTKVLDPYLCLEQQYRDRIQLRMPHEHQARVDAVHRLARDPGLLWVTLKDRVQGHGGLTVPDGIVCVKVKVTLVGCGRAVEGCLVRESLHRVYITMTDGVRDHFVRRGISRPWVVDPTKTTLDLLPHMVDQATIRDEVLGGHAIHGLHFLPMYLNNHDRTWRTTRRVDAWVWIMTDTAASALGRQAAMSHVRVQWMAAVVRAAMAAPPRGSNVHKRSRA